MMKKNDKIIKWCVDGGIPLLLIICLWVPDTTKALARAFVWTQLQHWDQCTKADQ